MKLNHKKQVEVISHAKALIGIHEIPAHSNRGADVEKIQAATGAFDAPWCVSFVQYVYKECFGAVLAGGTANAYALAEWAERNGFTVSRPFAGCPVVYHIGAGHAGIVFEPHWFRGFFDAVEGNEMDAVRMVKRYPKQIRCTFIAPPVLRER